MNPILITGVPRSGTSMTAGVINLCGAWGGKLAGPTPYNKKGMFENREIVNKMVKPLFIDVGADPMGQKPLPGMDKILNACSSDKWRSRFKVIMESQGYNGFDVLMYKEPKMCLMWELWHLAFPDAKWIIVRRRSEDIINSCLKTGFMNKYDNREGWLFWVRQHIELFLQMWKAELNILEVFPQEMIDGNFLEMKSVIDWLGLEWKEEEVVNFISPALWNKEKT
ncbi:MAG: hypothetical protein GY821_12650 [Gammaproteobacteria bacterium]|nr:hypothetical protein [Gammaproteobacteria bacterium]